MLAAPSQEGTTKMELIQAGIRLLNEGGPEKLTVRRLAALCGVTPHAPYNYFPTKDDLLFAIMGYLTDSLKQEFQKVSLYDSENRSQHFLETAKAYTAFHERYYQVLYEQTIPVGSRFVFDLLFCVTRDGRVETNTASIFWPFLGGAEYAGPASGKQLAFSALLHGVPFLWEEAEQQRFEGKIQSLFCLLASLMEMERREMI